MMPAEPFTDLVLVDKGGGRLSLVDTASRAPPAGLGGRQGFARGSALVAAQMGGMPPAFLFLPPHQVRELRDWLNRLLERHAANLPVAAAEPVAAKVDRILGPGPGRDGA